MVKGQDLESGDLGFISGSVLLYVACQNHPPLLSKRRIIIATPIH